jgi:hypothetical protein
MMPFLRMPDGSVIHVRMTKSAAKKYASGPDCKACPCVADFLCDYPVGDGTCDAPICRKHARTVGPNRHYCPWHAEATA